MCGRFTLRARPQAVAEAFELLELSDLSPRYNIAPTQPVASVRLDPDRGGRVLVWQRWGLIPSWARDPSIGNRMINARAETVATKPAFRNAFAARRCLIVADGYYEWQKTAEGKQPYFIHRRDDAPFAFAGLWERWGPERLESCTIITTAANASMRSLHDRMPVILQPADYSRWLDPAVRDGEALASVLRPARDDLLAADPVQPVVNNPRNDVPECVSPIGPPQRDSESP
jgi:putative SOS response-associated peptidase YedK